MIFHWLNGLKKTSPGCIPSCTRALGIKINSPRDLTQIHSFTGLTKLILAIQPPSGSTTASSTAAAAAGGPAAGALNAAGGSRVGSGLTALPAVSGGISGTAAGSLFPLSELKGLKSLDLYDTGERTCCERLGH